MGEIDLNPTCTLSPLLLASGEITLRRWSAGDPQSRALLVHGLGAHAGWFEAAGRRLRQRGIEAIAYDHRGFGSRKHLELTSYNQWVFDLCQVYQSLSEASTTPVYLMANSMGALLAIAAIKARNDLFFQTAQPLPGLVMFSPGFDGCPDRFTLLYRVRAVVSALLQPRALVSLPYSAADITRDQSVQHWIENDPGHLASVPGSMLLELLKLSKKIESLLPLKIDIPVLMLTAGVERIVNSKVNQNFFKMMIASDKEQKEFSQSFHDLMFDPDIDQVVEEIVHWQKRHAPSVVR